VPVKSRIHCRRQGQESISRPGVLFWSSPQRRMAEMGGLRCTMGAL
jgi:hypothetical protein